MGWLDGFFSDKKEVDTSNNQSASSSYGMTPEVESYWSRIGGMYNPSAWAGVGIDPYQADAASKQGGYASSLMPAFGAATSIGMGGINTGDIARFANPYQKDVIDTTLGDMREAAAIRNAGSMGQAAKLGALSGTNPMVARNLADKADADAESKVIAGLRQQGFNTAADLAAKSTQAQLAGVGAATAAAGQQAGINQGQFGMGSDFWKQAYQNALQPFQLGQQGAQTLATLTPFSGQQSTGQSTGTQTTTASPSPFSTLMNVAGLGLQAYGAFNPVPSDKRVKENIKPIGETYDGQPIYKFNYIGDPRTTVGLMAQDVEETNPEAVGSVGGVKVVDYDRATAGAERRPGKAGGGAVMQPYRGGGDAHEKFKAAFDTISGLMSRAKGGAVMKPYAAGGSIDSWNTPLPIETSAPAVGSWETTATPASPGFDMKKLGQGMSDLGNKPGASAQDDTAALRDSEANLTRFMQSTLHAPPPMRGFALGGAPVWGETGPVFEDDAPEPVIRPFESAAPDRVERSELPPFRSAESGGAHIQTAGRDAPPVQARSTDGDGGSILGRLGLFQDGVWAGKEATPMQRLGTAMMSVRGPMFEGPTNGMAKNIMEWNQARMEQRRIDQQADQFAKQLEQSRALALGTVDGQPTIEALRLKQQADQFAKSNAIDEFKLDEARNPANAVDRRRAIAEQHGLKPGTAEFDHFVLTGDIPARTSGQPTYRELNGKLVEIPYGGGQPRVVLDAGPDFSKTPEFALKSAAFASRMVEAEQNLRASLGDKEKFDPTSVGTRLVNMAPDAIVNWFRSEDHQKYAQAAKQWIRAFLRKESGAAISDGEFAEDFKTYFPQPGDDDNTVKQKNAARLNAMRGFTQESRGYFEHTHGDQAKQLEEWRSGKTQDRMAPGETSRPMPRISNAAEFDALPSGTVFVDPTGRKRTKP